MNHNVMVYAHCQSYSLSLPGVPNVIEHSMKVSMDQKDLAPLDYTVVTVTTLSHRMKNFAVDVENGDFEQKSCTL